MRQNKEKLMRVYFENPEKSFSVRELSKVTGIPRASVHSEVINLKKEGLVDSEGYAKTGFLFKAKKSNYFEEKLFEYGMVDFLVKELNPSLIFLFGSFAKGESNKESDIDLFVESSVKKDVSLKKFESKLGHKIDLFVRKDLYDLQKHLLNNVVNGIKLYGSFRVK
ncbi:MAG: nucleotidyltransferase domain-containing protein [Candidatus Pacearchaeota archaeon]